MDLSSMYDQFPKPTRPPNVPQQDLVIDNDRFYPASSSTSWISDAVEEDETPKAEKEVVDELLSILVDCLEKEMSTRSRAVLLRNFFAELEKEEKLHELIVERVKQSKVKPLTDLYERMSSEIAAESMNTATTRTVVETCSMNTSRRRTVVESVEKLVPKRFQVRTLEFEEEEEDAKKDQARGSQNKQTKSS